VAQVKQVTRVSCDSTRCFEKGNYATVYGVTFDRARI